MKLKRVEILVIIVLLLSLVGCSGELDKASSDLGSNETKVKQEDKLKDKNKQKEIENAQPMEIMIWHDKEEAVAEVLQKKLDELLPEIIVTLERKEGLTDTLKMVGNDAKSAPDMFFFAHDKIGLYAEMGILSPITEFVSENIFENYIDVTVEAATYQSKIYQLPLYYETLLFMYNKEYMAEDEIPATTEELYSYMKENTMGDRYGFVEQHSTAYYSVPWIHGFGGYLINTSGEPGLDSEQTIQALNYHKKFAEYMPGESEYATVNILFTKGLADATIGGPWLVPSAREAGIDLGFAPMPIVDDTGKPLAPYTGVQGIHVMKVAAEEKHDAIRIILELLTDKDIGIEMAKESGCAPANILSYEDDMVASDVMVMAMKQTAENAIAMPNIPQMDIMWTVATRLLADVNLSGKDPVESAEKAQKNALSLIDSMN